MPREFERCLEPVDDAIGDDLDVLDGRRVAHDERELVAAETRDVAVVAARAAGPCHEVLGTQAAFQPVRDHLEQLVTGRVAERVVDALEVVEVDV